MDAGIKNYYSLDKTRLCALTLFFCLRTAADHHHDGPGCRDAGTKLATATPSVCRSLSRAARPARRSPSSARRLMLLATLSAFASVGGVTLPGVDPPARSSEAAPKLLPVSLVESVSLVQTHVTRSSPSPPAGPSCDGACGVLFWVGIISIGTCIASFLLKKQDGRSRKAVVCWKSPPKSRCWSAGSTKEARHVKARHMRSPVYPCLHAPCDPCAFAPCHRCALLLPSSILWTQRPSIGTSHS